MDNDIPNSLSLLPIVVKSCNAGSPPVNITFLQPNDSTFSIISSNDNSSYFRDILAGAPRS